MVISFSKSSKTVFMHVVYSTVCLWSFLLLKTRAIILMKDELFYIDWSWESDQREKQLNMYILEETIGFFPIAKSMGWKRRKSRLEVIELDNILPRLLLSSKVAVSATLNRQHHELDNINAERCRFLADFPPFSILFYVDST